MVSKVAVTKIGAILLIIGLAVGYGLGFAMYQVQLSEAQTELSEVKVRLSEVEAQLAAELAKQPNIQATKVSFSPSNQPISTTVVSDGRVSRSHAFSYTATHPGTYMLVFDNSFSTISTKSVELSYRAAGQGLSVAFEIPPGTSKFQAIDVELAGEVVSGSFTIFGGSGNDVEFQIITSRCELQRVSFQFTLVNGGTTDGFASVILLVDGKLSDWSNKYYVPQGQQVLETGTAILNDCDKHNFSLEVSQTKS